ncbi:TetR family transcriptional regulator [Streptomyces sp. NPDC004237]|uniref:TetR/AcrR family transcriptional regulator n=1 Tax=Streptomyces sp. NPDC004237 TaxID=3154455 RepID=UPI0033A911E1
MSERTLRSDAARNYERILGAAVLAFEEIGPEVTLEQIAEQAEVSVMTLYRRFRNRDQLVRAVFEHVLAAELKPLTAVHTDDPWQDLVGIEGGHRFLEAVDGVLSRAVDAGVVRPELEPRDLTAIIAMNMVTVHPSDPHGVDRRRYLALVVDGLRPAATALPPPASHDVPGTTA